MAIPIDDALGAPTKVDVIRHHIRSSIQMMAVECHPFSTHTIVMACKSLILDVAAAKSVLIEWHHRFWIKDEYQGEFLAREKKAYNYFKHADRDPETEYGGPEFDDLSHINEIQTLFNIQGCVNISGKREPEFDTFAQVMLVRHPHFFKLEFLDSYPELKIQLGLLDRSRSSMLLALRQQLFDTGFLPKTPPF